MANINQYEPLWGSWYIESLIGEGSFGKVYKVKKEEFGRTYYAALKIISIPQNDYDMRLMQSEGMDETSGRSYFHNFVMDIIQEIDVMSELRGNSNIVSLEDHAVIEREGELGWDILIRMELLNSLSERMAGKPMLAGEVVKMGIHLCRALELCAMRQIIHRDIKPDNIFVSQYGEYKLGDFGIARQIERTMAGLSKKGTYTYMAPEVFRGDDYGASVDTYSLGIVMYRFLNQNRTPFLPDFPDPILPRDRDEALQRRMSGETIPPINGAEPFLNDIVLKACAYERDIRFYSATEMREALELVAASAGAVNAPPIPDKPIQAKRALETFERTVRAPTVLEWNMADNVKYDLSPPMMSEAARAPSYEPMYKREEFRREEPEVEISPETTRALGVFSGISFVVFAALFALGGVGGEILMFLPAYILCIVECALGFRNQYLNAFFVPALALYPALGFSIAPQLLDYQFLVLVLGMILLALSVGSKKWNMGLAFSIFFLLGLLLSGGMAAWAFYRTFFGADPSQAAAIVIPVLVSLASLAGIFLVRGDSSLSGYAIAGLVASQLFPLAAFALHAMDAFERHISLYADIYTPFFTIESHFVRIFPGGLPLRTNWQIAALLAEPFAFVPFFALTVAGLSPDVFERSFGEGNCGKLLFITICFIIIMTAIMKLVF
jgi:serine/threonine protein kinase